MQARDPFQADRPLALARTPPAWWYQCPARDRSERRHVLAANWQLLAHRDEVTQPGDYVSGCSAGEPWIVLRDQDSTLRALSNVCRHNGTQVAQGAGNAATLVCPYHGWTYRLDGALASAPRLGAVKEFDRNEYALGTMQVQEFGPLILVNSTATAQALELGELQRRLDDSGWERLRRVARRSYDLACNWKVFIDNYLDGGYHVPFLHPDLSANLDLDGYQTELFHRYSIQSVLPSQEAGARVNTQATYAWVYPNLMINRYGPMMDTNVVVPTGPTTCRVHFDWYFDPECDDQFIASSLAASEQVQLEDIDICASLQVGMGSMHFRPGPYAPKVEKGKFQFHRLVHYDIEKQDRGL